MRITEQRGDILHNCDTLPLPADIQQVLSDHISPLTSFVCGKVRYWIEYRMNLGYRVISQTRIRGLWGKEQYSKYYPLLALYIDSTGKVRYCGLKPSFITQVDTFVNLFQDAFTTTQHALQISTYYDFVAVNQIRYTVAE
jgi:hypothetical protein